MFGYKVLLLFLVLGSVSPFVMDTIDNVINLLGFPKPEDLEAHVLQYGYPIQTHQVVTPDGYVLKMHRIPHGRNHSSNGNRPAVFIQHGLLAASHMFFWSWGPETGFAYNLADAGFDVWMGNGRGNLHSRNHINLDPDHPEEKFQFFDFSWHEIGTIDVPAMIDYILEHTGKDHLHYIGHSQGGTVFLVMSSERPEYNEKIRSAHLLAGVGHMEYFPNTPLRVTAMGTETIYSLALRLGVVEIPTLYLITTDGYTREDDGELTNMDETEVNTRALATMMGLNEIQKSYRISAEQIIQNLTSIPIINNLVGLAGGHGGIALKQLVHYGQNIQTKTFKKFDYGPVKNIERYGVAIPPLYDLTKITIKTVMYYGLTDSMLDERDVMSMAALMPNVVPRRHPRPTFNHVDYLYADDAKGNVTDPIIKDIWEAESLYRGSGVTLPLISIWSLIVAIFTLNYCILSNLN